MTVAVSQRDAWYRAIQPATWRALIASFLGWTFDGFEAYSLVLVAAVATRQLLPPPELPRLPIYIGGLFAITLVGFATGGILAGILADYIGRRRVLMVSILAYAVFSGLSALSLNYGSLLLTRFLVGLGLGAEWGSGTALVGESWPPSTRGRAAGVLQSGFGVGFFLASLAWLFVNPLGPRAWRYMFLIGVLPALMLLWMRTGVTDAHMWVAANERRRRARERAARGEVLEEKDRALLRFTLGHIFRTPELRRRLRWLLVMSLTTVVGWWAVSTWIPQYGGQLAARAALQPQRWASLTGLVYNSGAVVGYIAFGFLADVWGRKWTIGFYYLGSLPLVPLLFLWVQDPTAFLAVAAVNGFFTLGQWSWMPVYLPELFPTAMRGSAISFVFNVSRYVAAFGPLFAGWLIKTLGGIGTAASLIGLIYFLGLIATPFAGPETKGQTLPE